MMDSAGIYQAKLERLHTRYARARRQGTVGALRSKIGYRVEQVDSLSSVSSVTPQYSTFQVLLSEG